MPENAIHSRRKSRVLVHPFPFIGQHLVGRKSELNTLDAAWETGCTNLITIVAWAGAGKTSLAKHWLARMAADNYRGATHVFEWSFYSQGASHDVMTSDRFIEAALTFFGDKEPDYGSARERVLRLVRLASQGTDSTGSPIRPLILLDGLEPLQYPTRIEHGRLKDEPLSLLLSNLAVNNPGLCIATSRQEVQEIAHLRGTVAPVLLLSGLSLPEGVSLLNCMGVQGKESDLLAAVSHYAGHPLSLVLVGAILNEAHHGDASQWQDVELFSKEEPYSDRARHVIASYERWLTNSMGEAQVQILRCLSLFDRPAETMAIESLRREPTIAGLTDVIGPLSTPQWNRALSRLQSARLVAALGADTQHGARKNARGDVAREHSSCLDVHPLIREYFAEQVRSTMPASWEGGHHRLYEHFRGQALDHCASNDREVLLTHALHHALNAGLQPNALVELKKLVGSGALPAGVQDAKPYLSTRAVHLNDRVKDAARLFAVLVTSADIGHRVPACGELEDYLRVSKDTDLENVLFAEPLPESLDLDAALHCANQAAAVRTANLIATLAERRATISLVWAGWVRARGDICDLKADPQDVELTLIQNGVFRSVVDALHRGQEAGPVFVRLLSNASLRSAVGEAVLRRVTLEWTRSLPFAKRQLDESVESDADAEFLEDTRRRALRADRLAEKVQVGAQISQITKLLQAGKEHAAFRILEELLRYQLSAQGGDVYAAKTICNLATQMGRFGLFDQQLRLSEKALDLAPTDARALRIRANALRRLGRLVDALEACERAIEANADDVVAKNSRAAVLEEMGRYTEALAAYERAVQEHPEDVVARSGRADLLRALGRYEESLAAYDEVIKEHPYSVVAKTGRAETLRATGKLEEALAAYDQAISAHPEDVVAKSGCAEVLKALGRLDDALSMYDQVVRLHPENVVPRNGRAEVLKALGRYGDALTAYEQTISTNPEDVVAKNGRAEVLKALGRFDDALAAYEQTVRVHPESVVAKNGRAATLRMIGRLREARNAYREIRALHPYDKVATNGLIVVLAEMGQLGEAMALVRTGRRVTENDWVAQHCVGMIHLRQGRLEEAVSVFEDGVVNCPFVSEREYFRTALAATHLRMNDLAKALSVVGEDREGVQVEVANVIRVQIFGQNGEFDKATACFERLSQPRTPVERELVDELRRRFVDREPGKQDDEWLFERQLLWLTVAG